MDELLSEKEQIEQMRAWWSDYGAYVIGGVVLGALILVGFNYYQNAEIEAELGASVLYDQLTLSITDGDLESSEATADALATDYGNSSYDAQSKLAMARLYLDKNRDQDAADALQALLAMNGHEYLQHVGRVRLAKILLYQDKPDEVLELLAGQENEAFAARYAETRGDAYVALDRYGEARTEYEAALSEAMPTIDQGLVQLKLLDLPREDVTVDGPDALGEATGGPSVESTDESADETSEESAE